jgi:hypothetical protein
VELVDKNFTIGKEFALAVLVANGKCNTSASVRLSTIKLPDLGRLGLTLRAGEGTFDSAMFSQLWASNRLMALPTTWRPSGSLRMRLICVSFSRLAMQF